MNSIPKIYWTLDELHWELRQPISRLRLWANTFGLGSRKGKGFSGDGGKIYFSPAERLKMRRATKLYRTGYYTLKGIEHHLIRKGFA